MIDIKKLIEVIQDSEVSQEVKEQILSHIVDKGERTDDLMKSLKLLINTELTTLNTLQESQKMIVQMLSEAEKYLSDFSSSISEILNIIWKGKNYSCELLLNYVKGIPKGIIFNIYQDNYLITNLEDQEGTSLQNICSMACLYFLLKSGFTCPMVFFDEPCSGLTVDTWNKLWPILRDYSIEAKIQSIIISHLPQEQLSVIRV